MQKFLRITATGRRPGCYPRQALRGDVLYSSWSHRDISLTLGALGGGETRVKDTLTEAMCRCGLITPAQKAASDARIQSAFSTREKIESFDPASAEEIYRHIYALRREALGAQVLSQWNASVPAETEDYLIDQRTQKTLLLQRASCALFVLFDAAWYGVMHEDLLAAQRLGKKTYILHAAKPGELLPEKAFFSDSGAVFLCADEEGIAFDAALQQAIDSGSACLTAYGEEALLRCRGLLTDAFVHARPEGCFARTMISALDCRKACAVYVPARFDVTQYIPLRERARLTFWHLYQLQKDFGDDVYRLSVEEIYRRFPQYFINMYENSPQCAEAAPDCPLKISLSGEGDVFARHDLAREEAARRFLGSFANLSFSAHFFSEDLTPAPLPYTAHAPGILVHAVRVRSAQQAGVLSRDEDASLRHMFSPGQTGVFSNFLFFMTPKLAALYNELRSDRPLEQADVTGGHLDYKLSYENGRRTETFPLFRKMCMAKKEDGTFLFFNYRLGGGSIRVENLTFSWQREHVNTAENAPVTVYTPALSCADGDADRQTYRRAVGKGRVNLVILQDRIHCIRRGDVILPSVGVVISLREDAAQPLLAQLSPLEDGYFDASALAYAAVLDAPEGISDADWQSVRWAYGGGLSLIENGCALCDSDDMLSWFEGEGWMSPLSRQTQESALHTLARHPRTAIGQSENGDMVLLVFSGRTSLSVGADYVEMCRIARRICPDIMHLMNVDGGASAVLCLVHNGTMLELNCPSTSSVSCAGMARPIKTLLYIPAEG